MKWHLKRKPWAVQVEALRRSAGRSHYGLHMAQGLGKSGTVFNEFLDSDAEILLVIVPNSFKASWPTVPAEWGFPDFPVGMWPRDPLPSGEVPSLFAINYEAVRTSAGKQVVQLMKKRKVFLAIDESSSIKGPRSLTSRAVISLAKDAYMVRVLNGTPLVQSVMDLFAPLKCLNQLDGMNPFQWRGRFAVMGGYLGKQVKGIKNEAELYKLLDSCSFRALKEDWRKDLPPKVYSTIQLEMTKRQRTYYQEMFDEFFTVVNDRDVSADMVLVQMGKLQQIASCLTIQDGLTEAFEEPKNNPKLQATLDILAGGQSKAIVVHFFKATGAMLLEQLAEYKPARIAGGMKPAEILAEKQRFNEDPECRVLIGQESATARGHTLIGHKGNWASRMVFFENSFSLMERLQVEDRIHRGEQPEPCNYYDLVTSPIDAAIIAALQKKKAMADAVDDVVKVVRGLTKGRAGAKLRG